MSREELRGLTGMVLQDAWLFGGTIEENIAYGAAGATHEQVVEAARATYVDRFVRTLPDGYDTVLDDDGTNVSRWGSGSSSPSPARSWPGPRC